MFKPVHVGALALELHTLQLEARTLLAGRTAAQFNLAACAEDPVPRQPIDRVRAEKARNRAVISRVSGGSSNATICAHLARGD